ncbi:MAG: hypothetical protein HKN98_08440, partial [Silicimonas sp.]|nr:hypothetical protein [Silicimonas sp.]
MMAHRGVALAQVHVGARTGLEHVGEILAEHLGRGIIDDRAVSGDLAGD